MKEGFYKSEFIPAEERNLNQFKGYSLQEVIEYLEKAEDTSEQVEDTKETNVFDGFLNLLRSKGIRVSTPEWLQFLQVIGNKTKADELKELVSTNELLNKIRLFAQTTLVKDKADEAAFHEAFNEYFELAAKMYNRELSQIGEKKVEILENKNLFDSKITPTSKDSINIQDVMENLNLPENKKHSDNESVHDGNQVDSKITPTLKDSLNIQEVMENLNLPKNEGHSDNESVHGGNQDQHNDILKKTDLSKQGGGNKKEGPGGEGKTGIPSEGQGDKGEAGAGKGDKGMVSEMGKGSSGKETENQIGDSSKIPEAPKNNQQKMVEEGYLVGGGKGNSIYAKRVYPDSIINQGKKIDEEAILTREKSAEKVDRRRRYEVRPDRASMNEIIRNIRRIILDVSEVKTKDVNLEGTVRNFARHNFHFDYQREKEKQPDMVLLVDVGGSTDEWSPLIKEMTEAMTKGLTKLEIYLFHNNLYGYVWKPDKGNLLASTYAKENSLIDLRSIIKKRKKVILYGDAQMSRSEFEGDCWPPQGNFERIKKFGMNGEECLNFINKKSDSVVWINPVFKKEWSTKGDSGTIQMVGNIIHMHDLTIGGVEDAVKDLMKK